MQMFVLRTLKCVPIVWFEYNYKDMFLGPTDMLDYKDLINAYIRYQSQVFRVLKFSCTWGHTLCYTEMVWSVMSA